MIAQYLLREILAITSIQKTNKLQYKNFSLTENEVQTVLFIFKKVMNKTTSHGLQATDEFILTCENDIDDQHSVANLNHRRMAKGGKIITKVKLATVL